MKLSGPDAVDDLRDLMARETSFSEMVAALERVGKWICWSTLFCEKEAGLSNNKAKRSAKLATILEGSKVRSLVL